LPIGGNHLIHEEDLHRRLGLKLLSTVRGESFQFGGIFSGDGLRRMAQKSGLENIVPILGSADDPKLPENSVDEVLIVIAYHEFSHPMEMMHHIYTAMKQDARMLIVEYKAEDPDSHVSPAHKMRATDILSEISGFGFRLDKAIDMIPTQHVFIFKKDNRLN